MTALDAPTFERLLLATPKQQERMAHRLARLDVPWSEWTAHFNAAYVRDPARTARAARHLASAQPEGRDVDRARFRLLEAVGLQRAGSAADAARGFEEAADALAEAGDPTWEARALVLAVDALAHTGRIDEALAVAARAEERLHGRRGAAPWRAALVANRANTLRLRGDLDEARRLYDRAARAFQRLGLEPSEAAVRMNAGVALLYGGSPAAALRRFEEAAAGFARLGQADRELEARYNHACALVRVGRLGEAIRALEAMAEEHAAAGRARREALCRMDLADALRRSGDDAAATAQAEAAVAGFERSGAKAEQAEALHELARSAVSSGAPDVDAHLDRAERAAMEGDREELLLRVHRLRAESQRAAGGAVSLSDLTRWATRAQRLAQHEVLAEILLLRGAVLLDRGRTDDAAAVFGDPALRRPGLGRLRGVIEAGRAAVDARRGRVPLALRRLRRIADRLDAERAGLPGAWLRTTHTLAELDPVLARVDLLLERGRPADRREAEAVLDALAARRFLEARRPLPPRGKLARLRRRLEEIREALGGGGSFRGAEGADRGRLANEGRTVERAIAEAWRATERHGPAEEIVHTARPRPAPLHLGVAAVHLWSHAGAVHGLARIGDTSIAAGRGLITDAELRRIAADLSFQAVRARHGRRAATAAIERLLGTLTERLLRPLGAEQWPSRVALVLDPALPSLPLELAPVKGVPLACARRLVRVPTLRHTGVLPPRGRGMRVVALGEADLPGAAREANRLRRSAGVDAGPQATRKALTHALRAHHTVHVTGHGFDAGETPPLGGVRLADGWFGGADVPDTVAADLVVLAACRTGVESGPAGTAWGALPTALLAAGARHVIWTAEDVEDAPTADLMRHLHTGGDDPVPQAFGRAIMETLSVHGPAPLLPFRLSGVSA